MKTSLHLNNHYTKNQLQINIFSISKVTWTSAIKLIPFTTFNLQFTCSINYTSISNSTTTILIFIYFTDVYGFIFTGISTFALCSFIYICNSPILSNYLHCTFPIKINCSQKGFISIIFSFLIFSYLLHFNSHSPSKLLLIPPPCPPSHWPWIKSHSPLPKAHEPPSLSSSKKKTPSSKLTVLTC